ncbi:cytoplasmic protein [Wuchereria bancrofti]|uniref:Cytoplasmic protein n=1 Tax=Wuchereria bancrofti TaxID=6293 RepID=J9BBQ8_WUCBA|nr:cytoplasmic protein [Wuchereria bancrofti]
MEQYFEWDEAKNRKNQKKHDISFETASLIFEDPLRISIQDRHTNGEERWQTIGKVKGVLMLLVAHTIFDEDDCEIIRIISARQVTKAERNQYEHVRHGQFYRPVKQQTSVRLDADVLAWLKSQGKGYQTRMNKILREAMLNERKNHQ